jgi:hypothetical protein
VAKSGIFPTYKEQITTNGPAHEFPPSYTRYYFNQKT